MIGLALVVAVNSLGSSFLKTISDEFDRSFARDLTVQPTGLAPGQGPQQTIARGLRDRLARIAEAEVVARERFIFTPDLPGPKGKTTEDGLLIGFEPLRYEKVDTTDVEGAPRHEVFERMTEGEVTVGKAYRGGEGPRGRRHAQARGAVRDPAGADRRDRRDRRLRRPDRGHVAGDDGPRLRGQRGLGAGAEGDLGGRPPGPPREGRADRRQGLPNLSVLSNEELKGNVEAQVNEQFGVFYAIVGVAIFASLFGIINTLTMSVIERTREIGVLRALGASRWQVRRSIADESLVIGLIGALLGIAVGAGLGAALLQGLSAGVPGVVYRPPVRPWSGSASPGSCSGWSPRSSRPVAPPAWT